MDKTLFVIICFAASFVISSCTSETNGTDCQISSAKAQTDIVKKYVEENTYIDFDVYELAQNIAMAQTRSVSAVNQDELAQMKVALYRFYTNVELVNDVYICKLTSAKDINVSIKVYTALLNNLNELNAAIQKAKEEGEEITIPKIDKAYLDSLLE